MNTIKNKYKDLSPIQTINNVKKFFKSKNYFTKIETKYHSKTGVYWCHIGLFINNHKIMESNGKGVTRLYALASGYAELYERFCAQIKFLTNPFLFNDYFELYNNDGYITNIESLLIDKTTQDFFTIFFNNNKEDFNSFFNVFIKYNNKIPGHNFINLITNEQKLFNLNLIYRFTGTTGLAAGNTLEEALVQGLSEWCERYVMYLSNYCFDNTKEIIYCINNYKNFPQYLQDLINKIEQLFNFKLYVIDLSYNFQLPVCAIIAVDLNNYRYYYTYGSAPVFYIALERCLTELFQGIPDNLHMMIQNQLPFKASLANNTSIMVRMMSGLLDRTFCPFETLNLTYVKNYNKEIFYNDFNSINISNKVFINYYKTIFKKLNIDIYYRDISMCQSIKAVKIYSSNINIYNNYFLNCINNNNIFNNKKYLKYSLQFAKFIDLIIHQKQLKFINIDYYLNILKSINNYEQNELMNIGSFIGINNFINPINLDYTVSFIKLFECQNKKSIIDINYCMNKTSSLYFMIYNYLSNNYTISEIQQILNNFNIYLSNEEINKCYSIEYVIYTSFCKTIQYLYTQDDTLILYLNSLKKQNHN